MTEKRECIERDHRRLSIARQCELMGLPRSSWYYEAQAETAENLRLMRLLDEQYTRTPFYGSRRMVIALRQRGWNVNRKRVRRLMQQMAIEAIYPKPRLSDPGAGSQDLSLPPERLGHHAAQSSLGYGYHLPPTSPWIPVFGGDSGLVQPLRRGVGIIQHAGYRLLPVGVGPGAGTSDARNLQFRSRSAIHQPRFHDSTRERGHHHQHGRPWTCAGQHLYRAALANREIRGGLS